MSIKFHNRWLGTKMTIAVQKVSTTGSHANWWENFPWTRLPNIAAPQGIKPGFDRELMRASSPKGVREIIGDGCFGGEYQKPDEIMEMLWKVGVEETREVLEGPWPKLK